MDFDRIGRIAKYFHQKPSSYFTHLDLGEAIMFDEACLIAVEINNQINEEKKKQKEKQKKKEAQFQKDMSELFQKEEGAI